MSNNDSGKPDLPQDSNQANGSADQGSASGQQVEYSAASALESFKLFRLTQDLPAAMVWLRTAALLDTPQERVELTAPVNIALLQVIGDSLMSCEKIILHCGNILDRHGELLDITGEALDMLTQRLPTAGESSKGYRMTYIMRAHVESLFVAFKHKLLGDRTFQPSRANEAVQFLDTIVACMGLLEELQLPAGTLALSRPATVQARIIDTAIGNAQGEIFGFVLRSLSDLDKVAFYIKNVERLVATLPTTRSTSPAAYESALTTLKGDLTAILSCCQSKDIKATRQSLKKARATLQQLGYPLSGK